MRPAPLRQPQQSVNLIRLLMIEFRKEGFTRQELWQKGPTAKQRGKRRSSP